MTNLSSSVAVEVEVVVAVDAVVAVNVLVAVAVTEAVNVLVPVVVPTFLRGYESEGKWMFLIIDMIFCVFCINIAR